MLIRGVRHVHVPGAVHHARYAPEVYKDAHVSTEGDAFYSWRLARHPLVGLLYGLADRGVRLDFGGCELTAEPLQLRRMLAQPGVPFGDGGDTFGHEILEGIYLLARDQADAALRNEGLGDGRGPTAGPYDAYIDGHFVAYSVVERVAEDTVALLLQLAQVLEDGNELLQRRDALVADGGVGRAARDLQPEDERTSLGRHQGETGRLRDDGGVGAVAAQDGREGAKPAVLLPYRRRHGDIAAQPETEVREGVERDEMGDEPALHVAGAASVEQVALQVAREWILFPRGRVSRVHGVGVEQDGASVPRPSPCAGDVRSILVGALFPDVLAVRLSLLARGLPRVHIEAALREGAPDDRPYSTLSPVTEGTRTSSCSRLTASSRLACTAPRMASASPSSSSTICRVLPFRSR